jgi:RNA polymerase sigma factor (sigma-70 family)
MPLAPENAAVTEEASLLAQTGAGDREAFRQLYTRYRVPLFSLAVRIVGHRGEAEELVQDAFVKIWRHAATYDARKSRPFTWAVTIMRRTCLDHLRKRRNSPIAAPLADDAGAGREPHAGDAVRQATDARETTARVHAALAEVAPEPRHALELALFSDLTQAEIAHHLAQPLGTVKSWIRRGLLDLRATLTDFTP